MKTSLFDRRSTGDWDPVEEPEPLLSLCVSAPASSSDGIGTDWIKMMSLILTKDWEIERSSVKIIQKMPPPTPLPPPPPTPPIFLQLMKSQVT